MDIANNNIEMINPRIQISDSEKSELVKINFPNEIKNACVQDQIRELNSSAVAQINNKNEPYKTEVCKTLIPDICHVKIEPQMYTCMENKEDFLDVPENPGYYSDHLSMYCNDDTLLVTVKQEKDGDIHEGVQCDICNGVIIGFRYTCVECTRFDLCIACESSGAHDEHYMLRIPAPKSRNKVEAIVSKIRSYLETEVNLFAPVVISDICSTRLLENCNDLNTNGHEQTDIKPVSTNLNVLKETILEDKTDSKSNTIQHSLLKEKGRNIREKKRRTYRNKATEETRLKNPKRKVSKKRKPKSKETPPNKKCRWMYGLTLKELWCKSCQTKKKCEGVKNSIPEPKLKDTRIFRTYSKLTPLLKRDLENPE